MLRRPRCRLILRVHPLRPLRALLGITHAIGRPLLRALQRLPLHVPIMFHQALDSPTEAIQWSLITFSKLR